MLITNADTKREPLPRRLRAFRDARGMSRATLAAHLGVTPITLYRWETGSTSPSPLAAQKLGELGFGAIREEETNAGSIPRIRTRQGSIAPEKSALSTALGKITFSAAPFVRNGPADQASFHERLIEFQLTSKRIPKQTLLKRLSMVESVDGIGHTTQHQLEQPNGSAVAWNSNYGTHGWHRYVGRFPPHVVRALLNGFGANESSVVLDPFAGSGTTAVECRLLGIPFIGVEICPLSSLMTRTKATFPEDPAVIIDVAAKFGQFYERQWASFLKKHSPVNLTHAAILARRGNPVHGFANVERWFTPEALLGVSITVEFGLTLDGFARDALLLALSAKMRSIGNVDVDVVRAEYRKKPRMNVDVRHLVLRQLSRMATDIAASVWSHKGIIGRPDRFILHEKSVLDLKLKEASVDFVITSPPYGIEAISYLRTHLLSYRSLVQYLEHDPYESRDKTIGSEYTPDASDKHTFLSEKCSGQFQKFFSQMRPTGEGKFDSRRAAMMQFFDDMLEVGERLATWLKDDGQMAFIIGNKRLGEEVIPSGSIIKELFDSCGLKCTDEIRHKLKTNNSNSQVPWQEKIIQEESILLFRRQRRRR